MEYRNDHYRQKKKTKLNLCFKILGLSNSANQQFMTFKLKKYTLNFN